MKKLFWTSLVAVLAAPCFGQGNIMVGNGLTGHHFPLYAPQLEDPTVQVVGNGDLSQPSGSTIFTGGLLSGDRYKIEFWAGPASASDLSGLSLIHTTTFRTAAVATSLPNGLTFSIGNGIIPGVLAGESAKVAVRAWDIQSGDTYDLAKIRGAGELFTVNTIGGIPSGGPPIIPPAWVGQSFSLALVPEPSSMALAGLGAGSLLIFRRRK